MDEVRAWLRQPTTVGGMSAALGTAVALLTSQISWAQAVPLLAGAAMSIILPDNVSAKQEATEFATRILAKASTIKEVK